MISFKSLIAEKIAKEVELDKNEIEGYIEVPPNEDMGDYAFPCFKLAKALRKAPPAIAEELKGKITADENIDKIEIAGGYLNFYVNKEVLAREVLQEISERKENYGFAILGEEYSTMTVFPSPDLSEP